MYTQLQISMLKLLPVFKIQRIYFLGRFHSLSQLSMFILVVKYLKMTLTSTLICQSDLHLVQYNAGHHSVKENQQHHNWAFVLTSSVYCMLNIHF